MQQLYTFVPEERLSSILETLQAFIELPIRLIDQDGNVLRAFGSSTAYCDLLKNSFPGQNACDALLKNVGSHAQKLGEAYIFSCHADLNHIAYPLTHHEELLGTVIVGPFLMDTPDSTLVTGLMRNYNLSPALTLELYDRLASLQILPPAKVQLLKQMMDHLFAPLLPY